MINVGCAKNREKKTCNMSVGWIGNMGKENEKVKEQERENITVLELKAALTKSQKWKSHLELTKSQIFG